MAARKALSLLYLDVLGIIDPIQVLWRQALNLAVKVQEGGLDPGLADVGVVLAAIAEEGAIGVAGAGRDVRGRERFATATFAGREAHAGLLVGSHEVEVTKEVKSAGERSQNEAEKKYE